MAENARDAFISRVSLVQIQSPLIKRKPLQEQDLQGFVRFGRAIIGPAGPTLGKRSLACRTTHRGRWGASQASVCQRSNRRRQP
jgi:hypothetical protein